jgi:hypothetical protein
MSHRTVPRAHARECARCQSYLFASPKRTCRSVHPSQRAHMRVVDKEVNAAY